ncbi:MAG TPA: hypothetical protein VMH39_15155, partial [Gemmatimonadaceae bacterium]|nr:hypothetical protein [Gemmatimonadaceae bacterium]
LVSLSLFIVGFYAVFFAWTRSAISAVRLTLTAVFATILWRMDALFLPINSMIGVRSTMPLLVAAVLAANFRPRALRVLLGISIGTSLLIATEQGLAVVAALAATTGIAAIAGGNRRDLARRLGTALVGAAATYGAVLLVIGGPAGLAGALRYNFGSVPRDQFWYFGGPPNRFLSSLGQLFRSPMMVFSLGCIAAALIGTLVRFSRRRRESDTRLIGEVFLACYAAFSVAPMFGTLVEVYLEPGMRVALILGLLALRRWGNARVARGAGDPARARMREGVAVAAVGLVTLAMRTTAMSITFAAPLHVLVAHVIDGDPPVMSPDWAAVRRSGDSLVHVIRAQIQRPPVIWSTYSGIVESDAGVFNPSFDYTIHALGPVNRRRYTQTFEASDADLVQTIRPNYTIFEEWLEANHWEFYRFLLQHYVIAVQTPWSYFWRPRATPFPDAPEVVAEGALGTLQTGIALTVEAPPESVSVLDVRLRYHVTNPYAGLPFFSGLPRYIIEIAGAANRNALSLAPYETERRFPVLAVGATTVRLTFLTKSLLPGARFVVDSVRVTRLQVARDNAAWVRDFVGARFTPEPP